MAGNPMYELVQTAPQLRFVDRQGRPFGSGAPTSFPQETHNSIHPLWVAGKCAVGTYTYL